MEISSEFNSEECTFIAGSDLEAPNAHSGTIWGDYDLLSCHWEGNWLLYYPSVCKQDYHLALNI